jgi:intracellular septation protein
MKQLLEFLPLVIFFSVYQLSGTTVAVGDVVYTFDGIYSATIALVSATLLQVVIVKLAWGAV